MLPEIYDYPRLTREFRWDIPIRYNIGVDVCDRWAAAQPDRPAIIEDGPRGVDVTTFATLRDLSNQLANVLRAGGVKRGDRVAILLPQTTMTAVAHVAIYKLGAVALPLAALFGADALEYRLRDAGAVAIVCDTLGIGKLRQIEPSLERLHLVLSVDGGDRGVVDLRQSMSVARAAFTPVDTSADDPALMIYTSGTTGQPKGALHAHRVLLGHLPGVRLPHEFFPRDGDLFWTPADWAWAGGLLNVLLPSLHHGVAVVARRFDRFDPDAALELMTRLEVRNAFIPPTALRMLRAAIKPGGARALRLRTLASGGEALGAETFTWARDALGMTINEFYGQTECNLVLCSCAAIGVSREGSIGKPTPGHRVAIIRPDGAVCDVDEVGQIAVARPDPVMFLEYWGQPIATRDKFVGDWMTTGDQGYVDRDGYVFFVGRDDDVITSAGFRIGPTEIEDCLLRHPAVAVAAVVGKKDYLRTEIVKAFVVCRDGVEPSDEVAADIKSFVRTRLSAHEYPREIEFISELPMTTTGKVIRRLLRDRG